MSATQSCAAHLVVEEERLRLQQSLVVALSLLVQLHSHREEGVEDLLGTVEASQAAVAVKEHHRGGADRRLQLEDLVNALGDHLLQILRRHLHDEVHRHVGVVAAHVSEQGRVLAVLRAEHRLEDGVAVRLRPLVNGQLGDVEAGAAAHHRLPGDDVLVGLHLGEGALEALVPGLQGQQLLASQTALHVLGQYARIVVGNFGAPAGADALRAVHQHHRNDGHVVLGLNAQVVVVEVLHQRVVLRREDLPRQGRQHGEDVTRTGGVLAARQARPKLPVRLQQVDVVAAHKVLRHVDDGRLEGHLAVVVGALLAHRAGQLRHLHLLLVVALEAGEDDLSLAGLQAVHQRGNRPLVVHVAEEHQLLVDKVLVGDGAGVLPVEVQLGQAELPAAFALLHGAGEPLLALLNHLLAEGQLDVVVVVGAAVAKRNSVAREIGKVLLAFCRR
ncbi:hypothetical protein TYRP_000789 [Tyrophagus putrescentiae]|nr:hypothetical protein TYRP_000789 [Tyrophagus putrescentiae]